MGPAMLLPLAGSALQYFNGKAANDRAQSVEGGAAQTQQGYRTAALSDVNAQANKIATSNPNSAAENGQFVAQLRKNVGGAGNQNGNAPTNFGAPTSALGPVPGANSRYNADSKAAAGQVQKYGDTNAGEMSAIDSAVNQRKNEALQMQTLNTTINGINQQSYAQNLVDQMRARAAGTPNPWVNLAGQVLKGAGAGMSMNNWFSPSSATPSFGPSGGGNWSPSSMGLAPLDSGPIPLTMPSPVT